MPLISNADLADKIVGILDQFETVQDEFQDWISGVVGGGPNLDGKFPLTDRNGTTRLTLAPAQLEDDVTGSVGQAETAQAAAETAQTAAETAQAAAELAETNAETAETNAETAQSLAEAAQAAAESARTTAIAQVSLAGDKVDYATEWANAVEDLLISAAAGGNQVDDYSALHHAAKGAASATAAATSETNAATSETNAGTSETNAATSAANVDLEHQYAAEWANKAEDSLISAAAGGNEVDDYSALHWSNKAAATAAVIGDLDSLSDVSISAVASGELIKWNGSAWINQTLAEAGIAPEAHSHTGSEISALDAGDTTTGTFADARIPNLNASKIMAGVLVDSRGGTGHGSPTADRVAVTNAAGITASATVTTTELALLNGITANLIYLVGTGTFTPGWTGFSSAPSGNWRYQIFGDGTRDICILTDDTGAAVSGTSNAATFTMTGVPSAARPDTAAMCGAISGMSSGYGGQVGFAEISTAGVVTFHTGLIGGGYFTTGAAKWANTGIKGLRAGTRLIYPLNF